MYIHIYTYIYLNQIGTRPPQEVVTLIKQHNLRSPLDEEKGNFVDNQCLHLHHVLISVYICTFFPYGRQFL
jgi:hypothetical protein